MCHSIAPNRILLVEDIWKTLIDLGVESVCHSLAPNRILLLENIRRDLGVKSMCHSIAPNHIVLLEDIRRTLRDLGVESVCHSLAPKRILLLEDIQRTLRNLGVESVCLPCPKPYSTPRGHLEDSEGSWSSKCAPQPCPPCLWDIGLCMARNPSCNGKHQEPNRL